MQISVVVPCYNGASYIPVFINSLEKLIIPSDLELEIVIVDNGSTDSSVSLLRDLIHVLSSKAEVRIEEYTASQGSYATRNFGVKQSSGQVLVFTDIDCILPEDYFTNLYDRLNGMPDSYIIAGNVELFLSEDPNLYQYYDYVFGFNMKSYVKEKTGVTANAVLSSNTFHQAQGFDEVESGGDRAFFKKVVKKLGANFDFCPEVMVFHPCRSSYSELIKKAKRVARGHASYYKKLRFSARLKRIGLLLISAFLQQHQFKVIVSKRSIINRLPLFRRFILIGLIFWIGFYSRVYTVTKTILN